MAEPHPRVSDDCIMLQSSLTPSSFSSELLIKNKDLDC